MDVDEVDGQRGRAGRAHARLAVPADESEERVDSPHPGPGQRRLEDPGRVAADDVAHARGLASEPVDIAKRVAPPLNGIVGRIDRPPAGRLAGMGFDQLILVVETDEVAIGPRPQDAADVCRMREGVEGLGDGRQLVARDFRIAPERRVVDGERHRE